MTINFPEGSLRGGTELLVRTVAVLLLAVPDALLAAAWDENQPTAPKSSIGLLSRFAPMDDAAGEWSAKHELAKIEKLYHAGGKVDFLDLDGPIRRLMHPDGRRDGQSYQSMQKAAQEVVDWGASSTEPTRRSASGI